jgi:hypothetical protein
MQSVLFATLGMMRPIFAWIDGFYPPGAGRWCMCNAKDIINP